LPCPKPTPQAARVGVDRISAPARGNARRRARTGFEESTSSPCGEYRDSSNSVHCSGNALCSNNTSRTRSSGRG
jgi:hypothetical protein